MGNWDKNGHQPTDSNHLSTFGDITILIKCAKLNIDRLKNFDSAGA